MTLFSTAVRTLPELKPEPFPGIWRFDIGAIETLHGSLCLMIKDHLLSCSHGEDSRLCIG